MLPDVGEQVVEHLSQPAFVPLHDEGAVGELELEEAVGLDDPSRGDRGLREVVQSQRAPFGTDARRPTGRAAADPR